jgi:peptidoglycan/LPS O-acetylase OafA/YrhL
MYHPIVMYSMILLLEPIASRSDLVSFNFWFYVLSIVGTVTASAISYRYFEQPFLRLSRKFAIITRESQAHLMDGASCYQMTPLRESRYQ